MRFFVYIILYLSVLNGNDTANMIKQQNVLYVKNMIETEEKIAQAFEEYLLKEFQIPTLANLSTNSYLGTNFNISNRMGDNIAFKNGNSFNLKYAIKYDPLYIEKTDKYLLDLYNRDLYRYRTIVTYNNSDYSKSYVSIILSKEGQTIYNILSAGNTIEKTCSASLRNQYCNNSINTIRWYNADGYWIEYSKSEFENSNVTIQNDSVLSETRLTNLPVGTYIRIQNSSRYIRALSNQILKVE